MPDPLQLSTQNVSLSSVNGTVTITVGQEEYQPTEAGLRENIMNAIGETRLNVEMRRRCEVANVNPLTADWADLEALLEGPYQLNPQS